jgi:hypothetical protein
MTTEDAPDPDPVAAGAGLIIERKSYPSAKGATAKLEPTDEVEISPSPPPNTG